MFVCLFVFVLNEIWVFTLILKFYNFSELLLDRSRENSKDEHMHLSDAVLESVMVLSYI